MTEAARNFSELVSRLHYQGGSALLMKGGKAMVKMTSFRRPMTGAELAFAWSGMDHLSLAEATEFEKDLKSARRKLRPLSSKWD
ncbi:MAG TPA: hypothetical protein VIJ19_10260 [Opitutaceae bacterium]